MTRRSDIPLTGSDITAVGEVVTLVEERLASLVEVNGELVSGVAQVIVVIERPDSFSDREDNVGEIRWHPDGWWGFYPYEVGV